MSTRLVAPSSYQGGKYGFESSSTGNGNISPDNTNRAANKASVTMVHRPFEKQGAEGGDDSRIVPPEILSEGPGQGSRGLSTRIGCRGHAPDHHFGEHEFSQNSKEAQEAATGQVNNTNSNRGLARYNIQQDTSSSTLTRDKINNSLVSSGGLGEQVVDTDGGGTAAGQSWVGGVDAHTTVQEETSHGDNQLKRTEQSQTQESTRETLLDPTTHHNYNIHRRTQEYKPQQSVPSITLATLSQPLQQTHAATAAEIALGISSPYNRGSVDYSQEGTQRNNTNSSLMIQGEHTNMDFNNFLLSRAMYEGKDRDEENTSRTSETGAVTSPGRMTPLNDSSDHGTHDLPRQMVGTPSTVSTAPSTDDASLGTDYKLEDSLLPHLLQESPGYNQGQSWSEESLLPGMPMFGGTHSIGMDQSAGGWGPPQHPLSAQHQWGPPHGNQPRVASFRQDVDGGETDFHNQRHHQAPLSSDSRNNQAWNQQSAPHHTVQTNRIHGGDHHMHYPSNQNRNMPIEMRQGQGFQQQQHQQPPFGAYQSVRKQGFNATPPQRGSHPIHPHQPIPPSATPPRNSRNPRLQGQNNPRQTPTGSAPSPHQSISNPQRSSSEILKTLLRKKACLYEPDTSRAVALVTWLVGKELALQYGFFSRQQLQSGVHACVSEKIDSGIITRTKVNRCMQIILNSCFHYIIPRSDGTEEKGDSFRRVFRNSVEDDSFLLQYLPAPWNDLVVLRGTVLAAALEEDISAHHRNVSTPKSSPKLTSATPPRSPGKDSSDEKDLVEAKRAVLLCFNENVRSAEDVFRCHNEFIRDTANAAQLQLTAQEWRTFFGREAARAPYLWGNVAIPIATGDSHGGTPRQPDVLGQMCQEEVAKFRTTWCTKRYDHDHDLCGFAHVEVNGGWLRRNPSVHAYQDKMCKFVSTATDRRVGSGHFHINECPEGVNCEYAHSVEEIRYHPNKYKSKVCTAISRPGGCRLGDVCPDLHPPDSSSRPAKKQPENRQHPPRNPRKQEQASSNAKSSFPLPQGSPVVYASPAPFSSFERQLAMPGLQNLYRRQCSVVRAFVRSDGKCRCVYSCFGDDWGIY